MVNIDPQTRQSEIDNYAALLDQAYPPSPDSKGKIVDFGADYKTYMAKHPNANPKIIYDEVTARLALLVSIPTTIGKAVAAGAAVTAQTAGDIGPAVASVYPQWLQDFLNGNGILRIAEGLIGVVILAVSLDKLMGGNAGPATVIAKALK